MIFCPNLYISLPISVQFDIDDNHKKVFVVMSVVKNQHRKSNTLPKGVNEYLSVLSTLIFRFRWNSIKEPVSWNCRIYEVKNTVLNSVYNVTVYSTSFVILLVHFNAVASVSGVRCCHLVPTVWLACDNRSNASWKIMIIPFVVCSYCEAEFVNL